MRKKLETFMISLFSPTFRMRNSARFLAADLHIIIIKKFSFGDI